MAADHDGSVKLASALLEPKRLKPSEALCAVTFDAQARAYSLGVRPWPQASWQEKLPPCAPAILACAWT